MKSKILLTVGLLLLFCISIYSQNAKTDAFNNKVTVLTTPEAINLTTTLVEEYSKINPGLKLTVEPVEVHEFNAAFAEKVSLGFVSKESGISLAENSWKMLIGRNVIVPVISSLNPFYSAIEKQGISAKELKAAITGMAQSNWDGFLGSEQNAPARIYILDDESTRMAVSDFLNVSPSVVAEIEPRTAEQIIEILEKDIYAIAFCRLQNITNPADQNIIENFKLLPLDKNGNGTIDYHEKIYGNLDAFRRGVWIGKYPKTLFFNVYSVSSDLPANENVTDFLSWVITDGQQFLEQNGYNELLYTERRSKLEMLHEPEFLVEADEVHYAVSPKVIFILIAIILIGVALTVLSQIRSKSKKKLLVGFSDQRGFVTENSINIPKGLFYDKTHTWTFMEMNGNVRIGIDDFLQHITGNYTSVKMKNPGDEIRKNEPVLTLVQKGKQINIYAPISGTIKEINEELITNPSLINNSPYAEGWVYRIEPSNWTRETRFLKIAEHYKEWIKNEFARLKDFLAFAVNAENIRTGHIAFQEGGEIIDNVLQDFGPVIWEEFQKTIIDKSDLN